MIFDGDFHVNYLRTSKKKLKSLQFCSNLIGISRYGFKKNNCFYYNAAGSVGQNGSSSGATYTPRF